MLPLELEGVPPRGPRAGPGRPRVGGHRRAARPLPRRLLRRPAAAHRGRPGARRHPQADPGRRAHRRARHHDRRRRHRAAGRPAGQHRRRGGAGDPRAPLRRVGRPGRVHARRPHRRRGQRVARRPCRRRCPPGWRRERLRLPLRLARREVLPPTRAARRWSRSSWRSPSPGWRSPSRSSAPRRRRPLEDWQQQHGQADAVASTTAASARPARRARARSRSRATYARLKDDRGPPGGRRGQQPPARRPDDRRHLRRSWRAGRRPPRARWCSRPPSPTGSMCTSATTLQLERPDLDGSRSSARSSDGLPALRGDPAAPVTSTRRRRRGRSVEAPPTTLIDLPDDLTAEELADAAGRPRRSAARPRARHRATTTRRSTGDEAVRWSLVLGAVVLMVVAHRDLGGVRGRRPPAAGHARAAVGQRRAARARSARRSCCRARSPGSSARVGRAGPRRGLLLSRSRDSDRVAPRPADRRATTSASSELLAVVLDRHRRRPPPSALIPARTAARIPTLAALAGRRPLPPVSRRLLTWGFAGVVAGASALLFLAVLGSQSGGVGRRVGVRRHRRRRRSSCSARARSRPPSSLGSNRCRPGCAAPSASARGASLATGRAPARSSRRSRRPARSRWWPARWCSAASAAGRPTTADPRRRGRRRPYDRYDRARCGRAPRPPPRPSSDPRGARDAFPDARGPSELQGASASSRRGHRHGSWEPRRRRSPRRSRRHLAVGAPRRRRGAPRRAPC